MMRLKDIKGGFNFNGRNQRTLFLSKSAGDGKLEHDIQSSFFLWLRTNQEKHPVLKQFFAIPNGGHRTKATAIKLKAEGVKAGVPDTYLPVARNGYAGLWIEFKSSKGRCSPEQKEWITFLESEGHKVHICRSWAEAARITVEYLNLTDYTTIPL